MNLPLLPNTRILHYYTDRLSTSALTQSHTQQGRKKDILLPFCSTQTESIRARQKECCYGSGCLSFPFHVLPRQKVSVTARQYTTTALAA
jgi:hypothetical protein